MEHTAAEDLGGCVCADSMFCQAKAEHTQACPEQACQSKKVEHTCQAWQGMTDRDALAGRAWVVRPVAGRVKAAADDAVHVPAYGAGGDESAVMSLTVSLSIPIDAPAKGGGGCSEMTGSSMTIPAVVRLDVRGEEARRCGSRRATIKGSWLPWHRVSRAVVLEDSLCLLHGL